MRRRPLTTINRAVEASTYAVAGPDRARVGGMRVDIVDKNVGDDVLLTETATDEFGHYSAASTRDPCASGTKHSPTCRRAYTLPTPFWPPPTSATTRPTMRRWSSNFLPILRRR